MSAKHSYNAIFETTEKVLSAKIWISFSFHYGSLCSLQQALFSFLGL